MRPQYPTDYISEADFAKQLDLSVWALRAWKRRNFGPPRYKFMNRVFYLRTEAETFVHTVLHGEGS